MQLDSFKDNFYDAVFAHTRKIFWPSLGISIFCALVMMATLLPLVLNLFPKEIIDQMSHMAQDMEGMKKNGELIKSYMQENLWAFISFYLVAMVLGLVLMAFSMRVGYTVSKNQLEGDRSWLKLMFSLFDRTFVKLLIALVIILVWYLAVLFLTSSLANLGVIVFFLALISSAAYMMRFVLVGPSIVIAEMSVREAFAYSLKQINWSKAFKLLFFVFVALVAVFIVFLIVSLILGLVAGDSTLGATLGNFVMLIANGIVWALFIAGSAGLLYRYGQFETEGQTEVLVDLVEPKDEI